MEQLKYIAKFLRDDTPESLNRLLVFLVVVNALAMGWFVLIGGSETVEDALKISGALLAIAGGWKGWQKSQELKSKKELQEKGNGK